MNSNITSSYTNRYHHMLFTKKNEFKFSTLRQFGSENVSFTATIYSGKKTLSGREVQNQVDQISHLIDRAFRAVVNREIDEKEVLIETSERRNAAIARHDAALKLEIAVRKEAEATMKAAERESKKVENLAH